MLSVPSKVVPFYLSFSEKAVSLCWLIKEMEITSKELSLFYPTRVLVWRLDEEAPQLLALCQGEGIPVEDLLELPVKRQREKAAERLLLCRAFGQPVSLRHDDQGAPSVEGFDANISITHTPRLVALVVDDSHVIGIDAEQMERQQVLRVRDKFLNTDEKQFISADDLAAHVIAWTAKEAIIKAERNSAIDWTDGICLEPFAADGIDANEITLAARCGDNRYHLRCLQVEGHCLTLAVACAR